MDPDIYIPRELAENIVIAFDSDDQVALEGFITELEQDYLEG